jgi:hypothetical protein
MIKLKFLLDSLKVSISLDSVTFFRVGALFCSFGGTRFFPDYLWLSWPCIGVCTFEEVGISFGLYTLALIREALHHSVYSEICGGIHSCSQVSLLLESLGRLTWCLCQWLGKTGAWAHKGCPGTWTYAIGYGTLAQCMVLDPSSIE